MRLKLLIAVFLLLVLNITPAHADQRAVNIFAGLDTNRVVFVYDWHTRNWLDNVDPWSVLAIRGVPVGFDGYSTPNHYFGDFTYPANGDWYAEVQLAATGAPDEEVWFWKQANNDNTLLVFAFMNLTYSGTPYGQHHFLAYSVSKSEFDRATGMKG